MCERDAFQPSNSEFMEELCQVFKEGFDGVFSDPDLFVRRINNKGGISFDFHGACRNVQYRVAVKLEEGIARRNNRMKLRLVIGCPFGEASRARVK